MQFQQHRSIAMRRKAVAHSFQRVELSPFHIELEDVHTTRRHAVDPNAFDLERSLAVGRGPQTRHPAIAGPIVVAREGRNTVCRARRLRDRLYLREAVQTHICFERIEVARIGLERDHATLMSDHGGREEREVAPVRADVHHRPPATESSLKQSRDGGLITAGQADFPRNEIGEIARKPGRAELTPERADKRRCRRAQRRDDLIAAARKSPHHGTQGADPRRRRPNVRHASVRRSRVPARAADCSNGSPGPDPCRGPHRRPTITTLSERPPGQSDATAAG